MKLEKRMEELEQEFKKTTETIEAHNNTGRILNQKLLDLQSRYDELEKLKNGQRKKK